ncbi:MAG: dihydroxyacetone kinase family protein, partial [Chloroflexota bacterium]|nr:dihydroxyacetone kinase family protein [Chloroflexota bacterium]
MRQVLNEATAFREEMIEGYVAAYGRLLRRVPGASGVVVAGAPARGKVTVIVGGGSGHYPAFYGLVGPGLADAGVIGDIFTSPSGEQAYRVARAADGGAGLLFTFGNYSGDVMNFGAAETRLRAEGIDARTVLVTDDVLSAPDDVALRRGIAGGFCVFKVAGASSARGDDLATVEALTRHANDRVRTVGVAFAGCTIPGQGEPLFTVPEGMMEVGLGIHGEPGVSTGPMLPAREIAALMVETLLADAPAGAGGQVGVIVNGLGSTKYEELFVLYQGIAPLLTRAGLETYRPHVGEFVTALDMAGCSLSLFWLDDDLRPLWDAPAESPAFTQAGTGVDRDWGRAAADADATAGVTGGDRGTTLAAGVGSGAGAGAEVSPGGPAGMLARACLGEAARAIEATEVELGRLDAAVGDGDHGAGMARGFRAASEAVRGDTGGAGASLVRAGTAFGDAAGG